MRASEPIKEVTQETENIKVLIADDDPPTRILLRAAISQWGYEVIEASNGEEAWEILQKPNAPRLLILDWLMPKLDGIGLCERIKHEHLSHPYIILLTQVTGTTNIIKGLEAGADEFLSKPFNMAELRSRLSVGARIIRFENTLSTQNEKLQAYASQMENIAQAHAKQLVYHSDLLSMLGSLIEKISEEVYAAFNKIQQVSNPETMQKLKEEFQKIDELRINLGSIVEIIKRLQVNATYSSKTASCQINDLIRSAFNICQSATQNIRIELDLASNLIPISANPDELQEVFLGLILSAIEAIKNQDSPYLNIKTTLTDKNTIQIIMEDSGPAIPEEELKVMLQPQLFHTDLAQIHSRLSVASAKEIIQKYSGYLAFENQIEGGVKLNIILPLRIKLERASPA